ncbi:transposase [Nocardia sp. NPDC049220]|uniref:transposase n=1 Tax=Nocardia sp. NPDC049220 TaxID=3155273 RepID=UPI0033E61594
MCVRAGRVSAGVVANRRTSQGPRQRVSSVGSGPHRGCSTAAGGSRSPCRGPPNITSWLRPEAHTCPQRMLCHTYGRAENSHLMIPGWPYQWSAPWRPGRSSSTAPLDAVRWAPGDATATAGQVRTVIGNQIDAGHQQPGDPDVWIVTDAGYGAPRLVFLLADLPAAVLGRMQSDQVLRRATPHQPLGTIGRPPWHGGEFVFAGPPARRRRRRNRSPSRIRLRDEQRPVACQRICRVGQNGAVLDKDTRGPGPSDFRGR